MAAIAWIALTTITLFVAFLLHRWGWEHIEDRDAGLPWLGLVFLLSASLLAVLAAACLHRAMGTLP